MLWSFAVVDVVYCGNKVTSYALIRFVRRGYNPVDCWFAIKADVVVIDWHHVRGVLVETKPVLPVPVGPLNPHLYLIGHLTVQLAVYPIVPYDWGVCRRLELKGILGLWLVVSPGNRCDFTWLQMTWRK